MLGLPETENIHAVPWQNRSTYMRYRRTASEGSEAVSQELFRARLKALIDLSHPLAKLARAMAVGGDRDRGVGGISTGARGSGSSSLADPFDG